MGRYNGAVIKERNIGLFGISRKRGMKVFLCKYDYSKECKGNYKDCVDCILDKIRAEIEQNAYPIVHGVNNRENGMTLYGILQIIDKYRESEDKE